MAATRPKDGPGGRITADEIMAEIDMDVQQMAQKIADAINQAQDGAIIDQSEEPVRDAHAVFRRVTYQKALSLLEKKQRAFSPSTDTSRD
jgi:aspartyl/asparaginyl-tRNA synthetase